MQHDLFDNPNHGSRRAYPFVIILQADIASEGNTMLVAPVAPRDGPLASGQSRVLPLIEHDGKQYVLILPLLSALPRRSLRGAVASLGRYRDDITRALDWLLWGI
jgi:toxin CcdB